MATVIAKVVVVVRRWRTKVAIGIVEVTEGCMMVVGVDAVEIVAVVVIVIGSIAIMVIAATLVG